MRKFGKYFPGEWVVPVTESQKSRRKLLASAMGLFGMKIAAQIEGIPIEDIDCGHLAEFAKLVALVAKGYMPPTSFETIDEDTVSTADLSTADTSEAEEETLTTESMIHLGFEDPRDWFLAGALANSRIFYCSADASWDFPAIGDRPPDASDLDPISMLLADLLEPHWEDLQYIQQSRQLGGKKMNISKIIKKLKSGKVPYSTLPMCDTNGELQ